MFLTGGICKTSMWVKVELDYLFSLNSVKVAMEVNILGSVFGYAG